MARYLLMIFLALLIFKNSATLAYAAQHTPFDFEKLFEQHGSIFWIIDHETGRIVDVNDAAARFYGFSEEELESMYIHQINIMSPEELAKERQAAFEQERNFFVFQHRLASGEVRTVRVYSYPYQFDNREGLFSIIFDVTEEQQLAAHARTQQTAITILLVTIGVTLAATSLILNRLRLKTHRQNDLLVESERKIATLLSNLHGMVYRCKYDRDWTMEYVSWGCEDLTGYPVNDIINNSRVSFNNIIHPDYRDLLWEKWYYVNAEKNKFQHEFRIITRKGEEKWVMEYGQKIYDRDGLVVALEGIITDVTALKNAEDAARNHEERLMATLISVGDGVITTDRWGRVDLLNPVAELLTGWTQQEAEDRMTSEVFKIFDENTRLPIEDPVTAVLETGETKKIKDTAMLVSKDGKEWPIDDSIAPIKDKDGLLIGVVVVFRDSTEQRNKQREIEYLSYRDVLTGLYNRRFFEAELERCDTARNYPLTFLYIDVNNLKFVNDEFGHAMGDQMIKAVAGVLTLQCRADDIIARIGGDEYAVLLPKTDQEAAAAIASRIIAAAENEKVMGTSLSVALGWATKYNKEESIQQIIKAAEDQMYKNKLLQKS